MGQNITKSNHIKSLGTNQEDIINDILFLYNGGNDIELDVTYSKGQFYKNGVVNQPKYKFDLEPQTDDTVQADSTNLPLQNDSIKCTMFDPPFIITGKTYKDNKEGSSIIGKRFSGYHSFEDLKYHYYNTLKELYRVTKQNGIVIFKCQNTISSGKQHFSHFFVLKSAIELGFYPIDEFILHNKSKITSFGGRWKTQKHAMKHHSFFLVLKKTNNKVNYDL